MKEEKRRRGTRQFEKVAHLEEGKPEANETNSYHMMRLLKTTPLYHFISPCLPPRAPSITHPSSDRHPFILSHRRNCSSTPLGHHPPSPPSGPFCPPSPPLPPLHPPRSSPGKNTSLSRCWCAMGTARPRTVKKKHPF